MSVPSPVDVPEATELAILRDRVAVLENTNRLYQLILDAMPQRVMWKDRKSTYLGCNRLFAQDGGHATAAELIGLDDRHPSLPWTAQADLYQEMDRKVMEDGIAEINFEEPQDQVDGSVNWVRTSKIPLRDTAGNVFGVLGMYEDITGQKRLEAERLQAREQMIEAQQLVLQELSTPLIPISDHVVVLPLIGTVDSQRAQQVLETLLQGISAMRARMAILDITGVTIVDTQVANALIQAAQAVRLLGAEVVLTGIRPEVAQTLVGLGVELRGIMTRGTVQSGIAYAVERYGAAR